MHFRRLKPVFQNHYFTHTCIISSSFQNYIQIWNIPTRSCFFSISKCTCMRYLSAVCRIDIVDSTLFSLKNGLNTHKKLTIPIVSYINPTIISSSIQNLFHRMFVIAPICPQPSQIWVIMIISQVKGSIITHYNYASLEDLLCKYLK